MRIIPTKSRGCCALALTPASPTMPMANPGADWVAGPGVGWFDGYQRPSTKNTHHEALWILTIPIVAPKSEVKKNNKKHIRSASKQKSHNSSSRSPTLAIWSQGIYPYFNHANGLAGKIACCRSGHSFGTESRGFLLSIQDSLDLIKLQFLSVSSAVAFSLSKPNREAYHHHSSGTIPTGPAARELIPTVRPEGNIKPVHPWKLTCPLKTDHFKRKGSSSNHHFWGANC